MENITNEMQKYRQCLIAILNDFTSRFDLENDWNMCDLFADVGCDVFDFLIAQKYNIPMKKKSKQYQADPFAMEEILIMPHDGVVGYYSKTTQQWNECLNDCANSSLFFVDFFDFDISSKKRKFEYILSHDYQDVNYLYRSEDVDFFLR